MSGRASTSPILLAYRPGEGVGPELVAVACELADAALVASGRAKASWVADGDPSLGLLAGPSAVWRPGPEAYFGRIVNGAAAPWNILCDVGEGDVSALEWSFDDVEGMAVLGGLRDVLPSTASRLRFGTAARVESHRRSLGKREPERFASTLSVSTTSMRGGWRFFEAAFVWLRQAGLHRAALVVDDAVSPQTSDAFQQAALLAASRGSGIYTWDDRSRETERYGADVAAASMAAASEQGLVLERRSLASALEQAWSDPAALGVVLAPWVEASAMAHVLARKADGVRRGAVVRVHPAKGLCVAQALHGTAEAHAGKGTADPSGMILAAAELLAWKGETGAAERMKTALASVPGELRGVRDVRAACLKSIEGKR